MEAEKADLAKTENGGNDDTTAKIESGAEEQYISFEEETIKDEETIQRQQELYMNLKKKLMKVYKQKKGDKVSLCPSMLKDLYELIMMEFSKLECASISIYEL